MDNEDGKQLSFDDLPDPGRDMPGRFHKTGGDTERGSAELVRPRSGTQRAKALDAFRHEEDDGLTDDELHYRFGIGAYPHVAGTRREELQFDGWPIVDSGKRRRTKKNTPAIVWVLERMSWASPKANPK